MKKGNKALMLINTSGNVIGGAQKRYLTLYNYIASQQLDDYYLIISEDLYLNALKENFLTTNQNVIRIKTRKAKENVKTGDNGLNIQRLNSIGLKSNFFKVFKKTKLFIKYLYVWIHFSIKFLSIIKKYNITTIYTAYLGGIWSWMYKNKRFKLIYSLNDSNLTSVKKDILSFFYSEYWVIKHADKIDFLSPGISINLRKIIPNLEQKKIHISPNSFIDYKNFTPVYPKKERVVFLSRLIREKNPILFLEAIYHFNKNYVLSAEFYIIGKGGLESEIEDFIIKNKIKNIIFLKGVTNTWEILRESKIFVSLQQNENYPSQSLIEAMACENAIITTDVGDTRMIVSEDNGILVDFNPVTISNAIFLLISDENIRIKLGKNARKKVLENHTIENFSRYFYQLTE